MANHKSAEKRHRQSLKKRDRNRNAKATVRTAVKKLRSAIESKDADVLQFAKEAESLLARAASKGILKKKTAARQIGRLVAAAAKAAGKSAGKKAKAK